MLDKEIFLTAAPKSNTKQTTSKNCHYVKELALCIDWCCRPEWIAMGLSKKEAVCLANRTRGEARRPIAF